MEPVDAIDRVKGGRILGSGSVPLQQQQEFGEHAIDAVLGVSCVAEQRCSVDGGADVLHCRCLLPSQVSFMFGILLH